MQAQVRERAAPHSYTVIHFSAPGSISFQSLQAMLQALAGVTAIHIEKKNPYWVIVSSSFSLA